MNHFFHSLKHGFYEFGHTLTILVNTTLLLLAYLVGIGPTAIIARLTGKRFLSAGPEPKKRSYWDPITQSNGKFEEYYRQF